MCDSCNDVGSVEVCKCSTVHVCEERDYYNAWQDAWGVWWRKCGECKGTGSLSIDFDTAVAVLGGLL
jgi:hypothetical protein